MPLVVPGSKFLGGVVVTLVFSSLLLTSDNGTYSNSNQSISVAFVGNSFTFVNDLPRVVEAMSDGKIARQDSCLHGSLTVTSLLQKGNGMYIFWGDSGNSDRGDADDDGFPDFGACTVPQLLLGYDETLVAETNNDNDNNYEDYYTDDGLNPCFQDPDYLEYYSIATRLPEDNENGNGNGNGNEYSTSRWDYVVINDQSMFPADYYKRMKSASTLQEAYVPMLNASNSIPILYQTWAYWREDIDMTDFVDIPTFTTMLKEGYEYYLEILEEELPSHLKPRIAPVGLAFLVLWEENVSFWDRLFGEDLYHPSPHGTYLAGCVIYATIFNRLPPASSRFTTELFNHSRMMQLSGDAQPLPTEDEALYLRWIAKRVALQGFLPKTLGWDNQEET